MGPQRFHRGSPSTHTYLVPDVLCLLGQEVRTAAVSQEQGGVGGRGGTGSALVLVQDGGQAAVLGGLPKQVRTASLWLQGAALGTAATAPSTAVQAGAPLDGRPGADLL